MKKIMHYIGVVALPCTIAGALQWYNALLTGILSRVTQDVAGSQSRLYTYVGPHFFLLSYCLVVIILCQAVNTLLVPAYKGQQVRKNSYDHLRLNLFALLTWVGVKFATIQFGIGDIWFILYFGIFSVVVFLIESREGSKTVFTRRNPLFVSKLAGCFLIGAAETIF